MTKKIIKQVNPALLEERRCFILTEPSGKKYVIKYTEHDILLEVMQKHIDESKYGDKRIPPDDIIKKLIKIHPDLKNNKKLQTSILRETTAYYKYYYLPMRVLAGEGYVEYGKDGKIRKLQKLKDSTPIKRGIDLWIEWKED